MKKVIPYEQSSQCILKHQWDIFVHQIKMCYGVQCCWIQGKWTLSCTPATAFLKGLFGSKLLTL